MKEKRSIYLWNKSLHADLESSHPVCNVNIFLGNVNRTKKCWMIVMFGLSFHENQAFLFIHFQYRQFRQLQKCSRKVGTWDKTALLQNTYFTGGHKDRSKIWWSHSKKNGKEGKITYHHYAGTSISTEGSGMFNLYITFFFFKWHHQSKREEARNTVCIQI